LAWRFARFGSRYADAVSESAKSPSAERHYDANFTKFGRLAQEVVFALNDALSRTQVKMHSVSSRVKERASFIEKIERKGYDRPLEQVQDLVGARLVCLFVTDLPILREVVDSLFDIVSEDDKVEGGPADTFGYMSVHYICTLKSGTSGPRYDGLQTIQFEIQCRTLLMDAWANVSHYLAYKGEASIPVDLRRDFHALAGLFYVADRHFEFLSAGSKESEKAALVAFSDGRQRNVDDFTVPIDRSTMLGYLTTKFPERQAPSERDASELVEEVARLGYEDIGALDADLTRVGAAALAYEAEYPPGTANDDDEEETDPNYADDQSPQDRGDGRFAAVGIARMSLAIARPEYAQLQKFSNEIFSKFR
jgi:putative GTP pyrophosphokinase